MNKNVCDFLFKTPKFLSVPFVHTICFISSSWKGKKTPVFCACFCILKLWALSRNSGWKVKLLYWNRVEFAKWWSEMNGVARQEVTARCSGQILRMLGPVTQCLHSFSPCHWLVFPDLSKYSPIPTGLSKERLSLVGQNGKRKLVSHLYFKTFFGVNVASSWFSSFPCFSGGKESSHSL